MADEGQATGGGRGGRCRPCEKGQCPTSGAVPAPADSRLLQMTTLTYSIFMPVTLGFNPPLQ